MGFVCLECVQTFYWEKTILFSVPIQNTKYPEGFSGELRRTHIQLETVLRNLAT